MAGEPKLGGPYACEKPEIALRLFEEIKRHGGDGWVAVRIRGNAFWEVKEARTQELMQIATATDGPELEAIRRRLGDAVNEARAGDKMFDAYGAIGLVLEGAVSLSERDQPHAD